MYFFERLDLEIPAFDDKSFNRKTSKKSRSTAEKKRGNLENRSFGSAEKNSDQITIHDRLIDLYLDWKEEGKNVDGPFIKCNYIEELVENEELDLKYISLTMHPGKQCFFSINAKFGEPLVTSSVLKEEHLEVFRDSIDRGEIPAFFLGVLGEKFHSHLYDHHLIINITKYSNGSHASPLMSLFLLLKPTDRICRGLIELKANPGEKNVQNDPNSQEQIRLNEEQYKKVIFELAKTSYFDLKSDKPLRLVLLLEFYNSPFASNTLKRLYNKRKEDSFLQRKVKTDSNGMTFVSDLPLERAEKRKEFLATHKIVLQPLDDLEDNLNSILRQRDLYQDPESDSPPLPDKEEIEFQKQVESAGMNYHRIRKKVPPAVLVETIQFTTEYGDTEMQTSEFDIFWGDGKYYRIRRVPGYVYRNQRDAEQWEKVGSRLDLDKFLLSFAKLASAKFTQFMVIRRKPMNEDEFKIIFVCGCLEDMEDNSAQSNSSQNEGQTENMDTENQGMKPSSSKNIPRQ